MNKVIKYTDLSEKEQLQLSGGGESARMVGLGIASVLVAPLGPLAVGWVTYNYYKD